MPGLKLWMGIHRVTVLTSVDLFDKRGTASTRCHPGRDVDGRGNLGGRTVPGRASGDRKISKNPVRNVLYALCAWVSKKIQNDGHKTPKCTNFFLNASHKQELRAHWCAPQNYMPKIAFLRFINVKFKLNFASADSLRNFRSADPRNLDPQPQKPSHAPASMAKK